jgi:cellobiose phosphorylase
MYRTILESILGLKIKGDKMEINPCLPKEWSEFSIIYTYKKTKYNIHVSNSPGAFSDFPSTRLVKDTYQTIVKTKKIKVDGVILSGQTINMIDDNKVHEVEVVI